MAAPSHPEPSFGSDSGSFHDPPPSTRHPVPEHRRRTPGAGRPMTRAEADELYGFERWGAGYVSVGDEGRLRVHPTADPERCLDLHDVVEQLGSEGSPTPLVLRFPQIIRTQLARLHDAFEHAIEAFDYAGSYRGVFPIKVNQSLGFLSELVRCAEPWKYGLESGTKPELALALTSGLAKDSLVLCNGYKDRAYVRLALVGVQLGYQVVLVVEKLHELELILDVADEVGVRPYLGLRLKISARGTGKWEKSGGAGSKFGLNTGELLEAVKICRARGWSEQLALLHFHIGSQITNVRRIKQGVQEGARFYAAMRAQGIEIRYLDVGGGLGVDYDGSRTSTDSSVNYTLQEYANDVVYSVKEVCEDSEVPVPHLVSESGRAVSAYHAMAIFSVEEQQTIPRSVTLPTIDEDEVEGPVAELLDSQREIGHKNYLETYHDTLEWMNQVRLLFNLGKLSLEERAVAEAAAAKTYADVVYFAKTSGRRIPEEIEELEQQIASKYVVNMSIFQTMPDHWAIGQLFPIAPIHRLDERPDVWATLADITCDSDGKIDRFGGVREDQDALRLHRLVGEPYHLGAFLLGAYQDVMGDYHNLLGEPIEARVELLDDGTVDVRVQKVHAQTSGEMLDLFGYHPATLTERLSAALPDDLSTDARRRCLDAFDAVLETTPYLT